MNIPVFNVWVSVVLSVDHCGRGLVGVLAHMQRDLICQDERRNAMVAECACAIDVAKPIAASRVCSGQQSKDFREVCPSVPKSYV